MQSGIPWPVLICYLQSSQNQRARFSPIMEAAACSHFSADPENPSRSVSEATANGVARSDTRRSSASSPCGHFTLCGKCQRETVCVYLFRTMRKSTHTGSVCFLSALWLTLNGVHVRCMTPRDSAQCSDGNERSTPQPSSSFFSTVRNSVRRSSG